MRELRRALREPVVLAWGVVFVLVLVVILPLMAGGLWQ